MEEKVLVTADAPFCVNAERYFVGSLSSNRTHFETEGDVVALFQTQNGIHSLIQRCRLLIKKTGYYQTGIILNEDTDYYGFIALHSSYFLTDDPADENLYHIGRPLFSREDSILYPTLESRFNVQKIMHGSDSRLDWDRHRWWDTHQEFIRSQKAANKRVA